MTGKYATEQLGADAEGIGRAAAILREGGLVAIPTETVYGLAARADSEAAVARIYTAKGRPGFNPLIVHVASQERATQFATFDAPARELAERHWPGPLTLVLPALPDNGLAPAVSAGLPTIALRCPEHPVMRAVLTELDLPLAAPSANRSGSVSPTTAAHVLATLDGRVDAVINGGECQGGLESTIAAVRGDGRIEELRPGPITFASGRHLRTDHPIEAPGQLASHYSPGKPLRLNATGGADDEFLIGFGTVEGDCGLSPSGDLVEAASRLYACLHEAAASDRPRIAVAPVPNEGIGRAINDRLRRAAVPVD
ncbi:L-threonylcarbamoyladenylate synthase [Qipengyuania sp. MTN3-11]|uniref:L-threonylcarbamoyladenylate synthase n=1 Tax=Qipengyuania sp. MTN3-11 TaxID=3056557 RepID=UPI0036F38C99